jgi:hypothetical protein
VTEAPFYIATPEEDELAYRPCVTFERQMHPPVYAATLAEQRDSVTLDMLAGQHRLVRGAADDRALGHLG